jgi:hypothetical protein
VIARLLILTLLLRAHWASADPDPASTGRDYQPGAQGWNGLSQLAALAAEASCRLEARTTLAWDTLSGQDVLLFVYPETAPSESSLEAFLMAGGRVLLADDFGQGAAALRRLGIVRHEEPLPLSVASYREGAVLPIARAAQGTPLSGAPELVTNHPAWFESSRKPAYAFAPGVAAVIEGSIGRGRFVALSDPSVLINNMLEIPGNRTFAEKLLRALCRPQVDRLLLLTGPFSQRGSPPAVLTGAPSGLSGPLGGDLAERWNQALAGANRHIQDSLSRGPTGLQLLGLTGLVLSIAALLLLLRYLPLQGVPHDVSFAQPERPPEGGLYGAVLRYRRRDVPWGYQYPAALLREEVLSRLQPYLTRLPRYGTGDAVAPEPLGEAVAAHAGPAAGRLAAALWRELRRLPLGPEEGRERLVAWISERRMDRLHRLAVALFAELSGRPHGPRQP